MSKIFITDRITNPEIEKKILGNNLTQNKNDVIEVLLVWHQVINKNYLDMFPSVKLIIRYGVGYDKIDLSECKRRKITVCNNPDYCTEEVSATAISMISNATRNISRYDFEARNYKNGWQENVNRTLKRNSEQTIGFIGAGRIGSLTIQQCNMLRYNTQFYDPSKVSGYEKVINSTKINDMNELLSTSDIVSLHCPLNNDTKGMVNQNFIDSMKKGSSLVNTARGELIKDLDIIEKALKNNRLNMVLLDVLPQEPPENHSLIKAWKKAQPWISGRLIVNPHASYYSLQSSNEQRQNVANNALRFLKGLIPINIVH